MVGANTFRNPGVTTKLATTLDHVSNGRAVLGIGGAWFEREHEAFGIDFGASVGERLDRLEEAVPLMRRLLDGERVSHEGRFYTLVDALCEPRPVQAHLPILVGGSGPKKTLRTVARHADGWNTNGTVEAVQGHARHPGRPLRGRRPGHGRDREDGQLPDDHPRHGRRPRTDVRRAQLAAERHSRSPRTSRRSPARPRRSPRRSARIASSGFSTVIVRMPAPFDRETIDRLPEVPALLG